MNTAVTVTVDKACGVKRGLENRCEWRPDGRRGRSAKLSFQCSRNYFEHSIKHLHRYLGEFEYSFNARKATDRFSMTLGEMMRTETMP